MSRPAPRVLITNDDGPPSERESPFILGFVKSLSEQLSWKDIKVVIPASQKSWIGSAYMIKETIQVSTLEVPREVSSEPWVLLAGTPATCSNIALYNLYPGQIDLVVSGPNYGRNTTSAFALSSGTVGAALTASMSGTPAIALSYGVFERPVPEDIVKKANEIACTVIAKLWDTVFAEGADKPADVYNVNIPLSPEILEQDSSSPKVAWTTLAPRQYGRIFLPLESSKPSNEAEKKASEAGPAAVPLQASSAKFSSSPSSSSASTSTLPQAFAFKPDMGTLINPELGSLEPGTDIWAIHHGITSITPLKATFAAAEMSRRIDTTESNGKGLWKL